MDRIRKLRDRYANICTENGNFEEQVEQLRLKEGRALREERSSVENRKKTNGKFYNEAISLTPLRITVISDKVV